MANDGGPAFPTTEGLFEIKHDGVKQISYSGMLLRDYFAGMALACEDIIGYGNPERIAEQAYAIADAMIAEREKTNG